MRSISNVGNTTLKIPPIIFGTSALGNLYQALDYNTKKEIVSECLKFVDAPVVFDSAGKYGAGLALEMLGTILAGLNVPADHVLISNKLGWKRIPLKGNEPTFEKGVWMDLSHDAEQDISYQGIMDCFEQGNQLLKNTYIPQMVSVHDPDEYLMHAANKKEEEKLLANILEAYRALSDLKKSGKVTAIGIGAKNWKTIERIEKETNLDWVMIANSMTIMNHPPELLEFMNSLHSKNIGIINSAVFHAGFLIGGKFYDYVEIKADNEKNKAIFKWREQFFAICKKFNVSPAMACVQFGFTAPGVISISLNTSNPKRVKENVDSAMVHIPDEFWHEMKKQKLIHNQYPYI